MTNAISPDQMSAAEPSVILIAPQGISGQLPVLIQRLAGSGIAVTTVAEVSDAVALVPPMSRWTCSAPPSRLNGAGCGCGQHG